MIALIQRVNYANVHVAGLEIARIERGILAFIAVEKQDTEQTAQRLFQRIINYRIFPDANDRMNLSLEAIKGGLLLVPQFTLAADTDSGNRPSFTPAASPEQGAQLFDYFSRYAKEYNPEIQTGEFGADMQVSLLNDGPVTFTLKV